MSRNVPKLDSIESIIDNHQYFLVDLWGVIHDGQRLYPGVKETLQEFQNRGKDIVFISNAPRRSHMAIAKLEELGIMPDLYDGIVTSGETTFDFLASDNHDYGSRCVMIGPKKDDGLLHDLPKFETSKDPYGADFGIITGFDHDESTIEEKLPVLEECFKQNIPLICANPDIEVVRISGARALCAGVIAKKYEAMGGKVEYFGKPYANIYDKALTLIPNVDQINNNEIAVIGDNIHTDIKGGVSLGYDTYLVTGGILSKEGSQDTLEQRMHILFEKEEAYPTAWVETFSLG